MDSKQNLKICFMGGRQAGIIGLLTVLSKGCEVLSAVSYSKELTNILNRLNIPIYQTVYDKWFIEELRKADLLLSVHGKEIIKQDLLRLPKFGAINIHPYLYKYKGAHPIERALKYKNYKASVGVHIMEKQLDQGTVLVEEFVDVAGVNNVEQVYNKLYPYYSIVILKLLDKIHNEYNR